MSTEQQVASRDDVIQELELRHVVVPLDGTEHAAAALPTARALARRTGAEVVELRLDEGVVGREIGARAAELQPSVVVMGTRARGRVAGALLGSTARDVLRLSTAPLVAVGPHADRPTTLVGRRRRRPVRWPEPLSTPRLVVAVDGSATAELALPAAAQWASALDMRLSIVTVAEDAAADASGRRRNRFGSDDPDAYVAELAARWSCIVPGTTGTVVLDPIGVASGLRTHLALEPAGLLAVATHVRDGVDRLRLGSTSADIIRTSTVPVLAVPVDEDRMVR